MPMDYVFDARQFTPQQGPQTHPEGKFPAVISNTEVKPNSKQTGGMFVVEFTTQYGKAYNRYNLWNANTQAVAIANGELSALCYATGVFQITMRDDGAALRNARCMIEVVRQTDSEGKPTRYTEIAKVYDMNGNEPGAAGSTGAAAPTGAAPGGFNPAAAGGFAPQQQPMQQPPMQQAPAGFPPQDQQPQTQAWGQGAPTQPAQQPAPVQGQPPAGWGQPQQPAAGPQAWGAPQGQAPAQQPAPVQQPPQQWGQQPQQAAGAPPNWGAPPR